MKKLILIFLLLSFAGCKSKKTTTDIQKESTTQDTRAVKTVHDTLWRDRVVIKTLPVYSETILDSPCDSLGRLRNINTTIGSGQNKSSISTMSGQLVIKQYIDSTKQQNEIIKEQRTQIDSLISITAKVKETAQTSNKVVYVYPWHYYLFMIAAIIFALLWVGFFVLKLYRKLNPLA